MNQHSRKKANMLIGVLLSSAPVSMVFAAVPNAEKHPLALDYRHAPDSSALGQEPEPARAPDLFGKTTGPLPFFGEEIRQRGYDLPDPYGIGYNYMDMHQNIKVNSINFSGLKIPGLLPGMKPTPLDNMFNIKVGHTREKSQTHTARLDTWLFPFMNIYGIVGHTKGSSVSQIDTVAAGKKVLFKDLGFKLKFKGTTYGAGTTLAYGYHDWFGTLDFNYTRTDFDILDGNTHAFTFTPRVGYRFTVPGSDRFNIPQSHASLWVGTMYQDVSQDFRGNISNLNMPAKLAGLVKFVNRDDQGRFRVKQHLQSPWNILVGGQYEITRNFNITAEAGFEKRNSVMLGGEFRF